MTQRKGETREEYLARQKAYNDAHKEERAAYDAAYRDAHKEEKAAYRAAHKAEKKAYNAAYYTAHKEEKAAYYETHKEEMAAYRAAHKEEAAAYKRAHPEYGLLASYCKEDEERGRDNDLTPEFVRNMIYRPCHYCGGMAESGHNGLDRMNSSLGHLQSNCVPCCPTCNNKKRTKTYEVFMNEIQGNV